MRDAAVINFTRLTVAQNSNSKSLLLHYLPMKPNCFVQHRYTWSNPASGDIHRASQAIAEVPSPRRPTETSGWRINNCCPGDGRILAMSDEPSSRAGEPNVTILSGGFTCNFMCAWHYTLSFAIQVVQIQQK